MKIGLIGTGNMGTIIAEALLESNAVSPSSLYIINRSIEKAEKLKRKYSTINIARNIEEIVTETELIFICLKPIDIYPLLEKIRPFVREQQCVVSITSPISVNQLENIVSCSVARVIPSITNRAFAGVSLVTFGSNCKTEWQERLIKLFTAISKPVEIEESITRVSSDIVSCGPAFFSFLTQRFIDASVKQTNINEETATLLTGEMLIGLGELLQKGFYTLPTLQEKVCVKGGITGEGIKVLESEIGDMFEKLFQATHHKFAEEVEKVQKQFDNK